MRFGWVVAACASISCSHVSTSDYGVAAAFAGVAGALQGAEEASKGRGSVRPPPSASCTQIVAICFPGTYSVCEIDANGCQRCNCLPEIRFDWTAPP